MDEEKLSDAVINALGLLKRVHRLSGSFAILRGELIHADISVRAFSSSRFVAAVQKMFDDFARTGRRAQRVLLHFEGQNALFVCGGPMILGFLFEKIGDLEAVETGVEKFIQQFGTALRMEEEAPEVEAVEESDADSLATEEKKAAPILKAAPVGETALTDNVEAGRTAEEEVALEDTSELRKVHVEDPETAANSDQIEHVLAKVAPDAVISGASLEEILDLIPDKRVRRLIENELG